MKRSAMPPREAPLRVRRQRSAIRLVDDDTHLCAARVTADCTPSSPRRAVHGHHRKRRSQGGPDTVSNILPVCAPGCHEWIHGNPEHSYALGLLIPSWDEITPYVPWWTETGDAA